MANEKRLIDADRIYDAIERRYQVSGGIEHRCERDLLDLICAADTVDAVEVVHGRWLSWEEQFPDKKPRRLNNLGVFCDKCHNHADNRTDFCPNCGARMDRGIDNG